MKGTLKLFLSFVLLFFASLQLQAQARLIIENNSRRFMTVKVMKGLGKGTLHEVVTISSYGSETIYFSESGYYFTKTKAVLQGKTPVYQKGRPFQVLSSETEYSVMTLSFGITESNVPQLTGGKRISKSEFDQN